MQTQIDTPNQALLHFLDRYCALSASPGYAVMLRGPWGSGKTWFIERYQEKLRTEGKRPLYVSLFGVSKPSEISDQFFAQIHPLLGNSKVQKTWALTKSLLKGTIKIDLDGDGRDDGSLQVSIPELDKWWASTEGAILIFDDLERCGMSNEDILGFINQFVEHDGYRVLVLANEEAKSIDRESGFATIKEKVIGRTFQIRPNAAGALNHFLEEVSSRKAHNILIQKKEQVLAIFQRADYNNLRQLRQAVFDFSDIWDCVQTAELDQKMEFVDHLLNDVLTLSIEHRAGILSIADMTELGGRDWFKYFNVKDTSEDTPPSPKEQALKRHGLDQEPDLALSASAYAEFFERGDLSTETTKESLANSKYLANASTASWRRLWYLHSLTDDEFQKFSLDVYQKLVALEYASEGELLHAVSMMLSLASEGLIDKTLKQMIAIAKKVVNDSAAAGKLDPGSSGDRSGNLSRDMAAFGLGFIGRDTNEFRDFFAFYRQAQTSARLVVVQQRSIDWMHELEENPELWAKHLVRIDNEECWFSDEAVFVYVSADKFAKILEKASTPTLQVVLRSFKERYTHPHEYTKWKLAELSFLQKVHTKLSAKVKSHRGQIRLSIHSLKTWFLPSLEIIIKDWETFQNQLSNASAKTVSP